MANLIITVIAIALVAIASLMGAYYGGSAFLNNQSSANASTVLNQGQQLAGAWDAFLSDNQNTPPTAAQGLGILVTDNYLAQLPNYPAGPGAATGVFTIEVVGAHTYAYADMGLGGTGAPSTTDNNASACMRVIKTAVGGGASGSPTGGGTLAAGTLGTIASTATSGNGTFGCAYVAGGVPAGYGGAAIPAKSYVVEYKLQ